MKLELDADQLDGFRCDGFVVVEGVLSTAETDAMRARAIELATTVDLEAEGSATIFSATDQSHAQDEYFLSSGDVIRYFFEDGAFVDGELDRPVELALNKIGHALHTLDPVFAPISNDPQIYSAASALGLAEPDPLQSMYIFKQPGIGGEVGSHTDHTFLWTEPRSAIGLWFAIDDATEENGCLRALPGGHRIPVKSRFRRLPDDRSTTMEVFDPTPYPTEGEVPLEVAAGTMIVLDSALPHRSLPNTSPKPRHAYTLHLIDKTADYPADNWLRR